MSGSRDTDRDGAVPDGLNTSVEYRGRQFHVQTQFSTRQAPTVETLVFFGGQALVRLTASYDDIARRLGFTGDDGRHLLGLQHDDLIRKIRHGMLRDEVNEDDAPLRPAEAVRFVDGDGITIDPSEIDDPAVLELLQELGVAIDAARPEAGSPEATEAVEAEAPESPEAPAGRPWWRRFAVAIRFRT